MREFDERQEARSAPQPARPATGPAEAAELASVVGNQAMQRIARSEAGQQLPVGPESVAPAARVLARQASEEDEEMIVPPMPAPVPGQEGDAEAGGGASPVVLPAPQGAGEYEGGDTGSSEPDEERD